MLGRLIQENDSIVVGKRGQRSSVLNRESASMPEDAVADRSLRFPAFCNALRKTFSVWTKLLVCRSIHVCRSPHYKISKPLMDNQPFYEHSNLILKVVVKEGFYCTAMLKILDPLSYTTLYFYMALQPHAFSMAFMRCSILICMDRVHYRGFSTLMMLIEISDTHLNFRR